MSIPYYEISAFTDDVFAGNPAGVCLLDEWAPDETLQRIAAQNGMSETAFIVDEPRGRHLRWFTPASEVKLCGHATLASAHVLFAHENCEDDEIVFHTLSGELRVRQTGINHYAMNFPSRESTPCEPPAGLVEALGAKPQAARVSAEDLLAVFETQSEMLGVQPDFEKLKNVDARGVIITAPSDDDEYDCVSRFFAPRFGVDEDPVTGSAHCVIAPYWRERLGKPTIVARQASQRGGTVRCTVDGDRVTLEGTATTYVCGELFVQAAAAV